MSVKIEARVTLAQVHISAQLDITQFTTVAVASRGLHSVWQIGNSLLG